MKNNLILAPKGAKIVVDSLVLVTTGVNFPIVATVKAINSNERCSLTADYNGYSIDRYISELEPLVEDTTPTVDVVLQRSGDGSKQYDWVKTVLTEGKFVAEIVLPAKEYAIKKKIQDFKATLSVKDRSEFNVIIEELVEFTKNETESLRNEE